MAKRYYWLKLKEDFFEEDALEWLEEQEPNGKEYCLFYLKLCLKSIRTNGVLIRNVGKMLIPYDMKKLSEMTNTDFDTVVVAMELLKQIGLVEILENGEIYMTQLQTMVGSETDKAVMMRKKRALEKGEGNNITKALPNCYTDIDKEKDIDIEKEKDIEVIEEPEEEPPAPPQPPKKEKPKKPKKEKPVKHKHGEYQNVLLTDNEFENLATKYGVELRDKAIKFLDEYIEEKAYKSASHNLAIQRWVIDAVKEKEQKAMRNAPVRQEVVPDWMKKKTKPVNSFNSFSQQRNYDYEDLEKSLFENEGNTEFEERKAALQQKLKEKYGK